MSAHKFFFVFDVESIGLHGEGYAVGYVVKDLEGNQHEEGCFACYPGCAVGNESSFEWVKKNIPEIKPTHDSPWLVRAAFWRRWLEWRGKDAILVADCAWPVETRFLEQCVDDSPYIREWEGPYPLHELATILLLLGKDPKAVTERLPSEKPQHHPLADAKHSARQLLEALAELKAGAA